MEQNKEYYAFISYKREDKKEAKRLQHALEYYRLPNHLRQENPELPEYVRPVFRDMTDLEVGELSAQIHAGLEQSHFLIVVCSPRAATSKWVNDELEYFISLGKQDKIIPYIIEGVPHASNPDEECYPPSLLNLSKEKELLGANINEVGKDSATIRVVSRMFNIRFDTLYQRYEREQRRKRWMWIGGSILIALLGLSIGGYFLRQNGIIERQKERLQQDSITMANHLLRIQKDSIMLSNQNDSIALQNNLILSQRDSLDCYTKDLLEERNRVLMATRETSKQLLLLVAQKANEMMDNGDYMGAKKQLLQIEDMGINIPFFTPEIEQAIRRAVMSNSGVIKAHFSPIKECLLSSDGKTIISSSSNEPVKLWNTRNGSLLASIQNSEYSPTLKLSPRDILFISYNDSVVLWNIKIIKKLKSFSFKGGSLKDVDKSNRMLFIDGNGKVNKISIVDGNSGNILSDFLTTSKLHITSALFLPNNQIVTASLDDDSIRIYDITNKRVARKWKAHEYGISFISINTDGTKIVSGEFGKISFAEPVNKKDSLKVWDTKTGHMISSIPISVNKACFRPDDGKIVAAKGKDNFIVDWEDGSIVNTNMKHETPIRALNISSDGSLIVTASHDDSVIKLWDNFFNNPSIEKKGSIYTCGNSFNPQGDKFIISTGDSIALYDTNSAMLIRKVKSLLSSTSIFKFAKNRNVFVSVSGAISGVACIWEANSLKRISVIQHLIEYADISPNGNDVVCVDGRKGKNNSISIWDVSRPDSVIKTPRYVINCGGGDINCATFSPDGKKIISAHNDGYIRIWDFDKCVLIDSLVGHNINVQSAFYSHNGKYIVSSSADRTIKIWDVKKRKCIRNLIGHTGEVCYAEFSTDDQYIISTSHDNTCIIWHAMSGIPLYKYHSQGSYASISPNNKYILILDFNKAFRLLPFESVRDIWTDMKLKMK